MTIDIQESIEINKSIYKNIDLIIKFCNQIPDIFINASVEEKQLLLRMIIDEITYAEGGVLQVKLKPIFEALRVIKHASTNSEVNSVRKEEKPTDCEVRTLETRIIPNKKASCEANFVNGASSGIVLTCSR